VSSPLSGTQASTPVFFSFAHAIHYYTTLTQVKKLMFSATMQSRRERKERQRSKVARSTMMQQTRKLVRDVDERLIDMKHHASLFSAKAQALTYARAQTQKHAGGGEGDTFLTDGLAWSSDEEDVSADDMPAPAADALMDRYARYKAPVMSDKEASLKLDKHSRGGSGHLYGSLVKSHSMRYVCVCVCVCLCILLMSTFVCFTDIQRVACIARELQREYVFERQSWVARVE
jgi:hypothetical protein